MTRVVEQSHLLYHGCRAVLDDLIRTRIAEVNAGPADHVPLAEGFAQLRARIARAT